MQTANYTRFYCKACFVLIFVHLEIIDSKSKCQNTNGKVIIENPENESNLAAGSTAKF